MAIWKGVVMLPFKVNSCLTQADAQINQLYKDLVLQLV